jgi:hypothetical protein
MFPEDLATAMPTIRSRCEEIDRDPDTLSVSVHIWWEQATEPGAARVERLAAYRDLGVRRVQMLVRNSVDDDDAVSAFAEDCRAAGVELD